MNNKITKNKINKKQRYVRICGEASYEKKDNKKKIKKRE